MGLPVLVPELLEGPVHFHTDMNSMDSVLRSHRVPHILLPDPLVGIGKWRVVVHKVMGLAPP